MRKQKHGGCLRYIESPSETMSVTGKCMLSDMVEVKRMVGGEIRDFLSSSAA
jgi:hypothetical protein